MSSQDNWKSVPVSSVWGSYFTVEHIKAPYWLGLGLALRLARAVSYQYVFHHEVITCVTDLNKFPAKDTGTVMRFALEISLCFT